MARSRGLGDGQTAGPSTSLRSGRDGKRLLSSNYCTWKHGPTLCHLDRSAAKWRDLRFSGPFLEMFLDRA
jgi:hypothetical protein